MSAITVGEDLVHYEVLGRGRPVILLHGWIGSWRYWIPLMRQLQMKYRAYAIDFFGFGDSSKNPQRYSVSQQVNLLDDFIQQMGIPKVAFIAHGLGAHVAIEFASQFPDRIARMLIIGAPLFDPGDLATRVPAGQRVLLTHPAAAVAEPGTVSTPLPVGLQQAALEKGEETLRSTNGMTLPRNTRPEQNNNPLRAALEGGMSNLLSQCFKRSDTEYERFQADIAKADEAALFASANGFDAGKMLDTIRMLKIPQVFVHGDDDPIVPNPGDGIWDYLTLGNEDTLLPIPLPGVQHFPMIEHEPFQRLVGLFLETYDVSKIEVKNRWRRRSR